ncbi:hypothetical protein ABVT39_015495 [Epinephelus coioides]
MATHHGEFPRKKTCEMILQSDDDEDEEQKTAIRQMREDYQDGFDPSEEMDQRPTASPSKYPRGRDEETEKLRTELQLVAMPRDKSHRRSEAAKRRMAERRIRIGVPQRESSETVVARRGTGWRHRVNPWKVSPHTGRFHKLHVPPRCFDPGKKFVLLVGASHLRSIADEIVREQDGCLAFGAMSTPGACADQLRMEVVQASLPLQPMLVVVMAPSNNLTASRTIEEVGLAFWRYLATVCTIFPCKVCVADMVPRLTVPGDYQELMRQEFHRVAASLNVSYISTADHFPLDRLKLWCPDGVHLSDDYGMPKLVELLWVASYQQLETPAPSPQVQHQRNHSGNPEDSSGVSKKRVVHCQVDGAPVALKECFIPLNPVRFSPDILAAMDKVVPSALGSAPTGIETVPGRRTWKTAVMKRKPIRQQVPARQPTVQVSPGVKREGVKLKRHHSGVSADSSAAPKQRVVNCQVDGAPVLHECFIPLQLPPDRIAVDIAVPTAPGGTPIGKEPIDACLCEGCSGDWWLFTCG